MTHIHQNVKNKQREPKPKKSNQGIFLWQNKTKPTAVVKTAQLVKRGHGLGETVWNPFKYFLFN